MHHTISVKDFSSKSGKTMNNVITVRKVRTPKPAGNGECWKMYWTQTW
jgi:hypothetical protein